MSETSVSVREMEIDDLAPIFHLGEDLFTSDRYPFLYRTWDEFEVIGLYNTDQEYCLVARDDETDELAGFVLGTVIYKASWTYGYIIWLGVSPKFQKRGVADKLVDKLVERMVEEGVRYMLVDTDPRNTPAIRFFERKGFGAPRDHIVLSMHLAKHERYGRLIAREREKEEVEKAVKAERRRRKQHAGLISDTVGSEPGIPGQLPESLLLAQGEGPKAPPSLVGTGSRTRKKAAGATTRSRAGSKGADSSGGDGGG